MFVSSGYLIVVLIVAKMMRTALQVVNLLKLIVFLVVLVVQNVRAAVQTVTGND